MFFKEFFLQAVGTHEGVSECAVVGQDDPVMGERPVAFVVTKPGQWCRVYNVQGGGGEIRSKSRISNIRYK